MPSRQDQLQSYQFSTQRVVAALVTHDSDPAQSPLRRTAGATMAGVIATALALAGVVVYSVIAGGDTNEWRDENAVFVEKNSGAKYVYIKPDDKLHPVLNYSSALLLAGSGASNPKQISRKSLAKASIGAPLGIPGAPDLLPSRGDLLTKPWVLCSQPGASAGSSSLLALGAEIRGGHVVTPPNPGVVPEATLVATPDNQQYLIYNNRRYRIPQPQIALAALGWSNQQATPVAPALINALPAGVEVRAVTVPDQDRDKPSAVVRGAKIGQIYTAKRDTNARDYAVVLADGVANLTAVQALLLLADPQTAALGARATIEVDIGTFARLPPSKTPRFTQDSADALPATPPGLVAATKSVCVSVENAAKQVTSVTVNADVPADMNVSETPSSMTTGTVLADRVAVPHGGGVVVEAAASPNAPPFSGALSVITDTGTRYPIAGRSLLEKLGYGGYTPLRMPAELVAMLPAGPALDPQTARTKA
jgi:type VII secretion protein EccB